MQKNILFIVFLTLHISAQPAQSAESAQKTPPSELSYRHDPYGPQVHTPEMTVFEPEISPVTTFLVTAYTTFPAGLAATVRGSNKLQWFTLPLAQRHAIAKKLTKAQIQDIDDKLRILIQNKLLSPTKFTKIMKDINTRHSRKTNNIHKKPSPPARSYSIEEHRKARNTDHT